MIQKLREGEKLHDHERDDSFQNSEAQSRDKTINLRSKTETHSKDINTQTGSDIKTETKSTGKKSAAESEAIKETEGTGEKLKQSQDKDSISESPEDDVKKEEITPTDSKDNGESKKEKQKAKKKEYAKYNITNNADYKIRKKLDEADKLLEQVRAGQYL